MWFWVALISAIFGAVEITLSKRILGKVSPAVLSWSLFALTLPILVPLALWQGVPNINSLFLVGVIGSSLVFVLSRTLFNSALRDNLVSQLLPLTAFTGLFTYIFGLVLLSETLRLIPVAGLFMIIIGSYILNADQAREDILEPFKLLFRTKGSLLILASIVLGSITAILDKVGLKNTFPENPVFTVMTEQLIQAALMSGYLVGCEKKTCFPVIKQNFIPLLLVSSLFLLGSLLVFYAYMDGPVALVIGVRRLQIFFILILGYIFLKDKPTRHSWIATTIMVLGVIMIRLG